MFFPRWLVSLAIVCLLAFARTAAAERATVPNLVFITVDTLRADHLGCYGDQQVRTPNIDALAADGFRFTRAYTSVPVTLPSHTVIFTGTYPMFSGIHDFAGNQLAATQPTLASVLQRHGYDTGAVVASAVLDSRFGLNRGFQTYDDHFGPPRTGNYEHRAVRRCSVPARRTLQNPVQGSPLRWRDCVCRRASRADYPVSEGKESV